MKTADYKQITKEYANWMDVLGFSQSHVNGHKNRLYYFFEWLEKKGILSIQYLTEQHLTDYFEYLQNRQNIRKGGALGTSSLNHHFYAIDKLCEFLKQYGLETAPSPLNFRIQVNENERIEKIKVFTQEEIKILQANIEKTYTSNYHYHLKFHEKEAKREQLRLVFTLCYGCGLRRSEAAKLTIQDLDFDKQTVFVKQGKNYKDRIIPMNKVIYDDLQNYLYNFRNLQKVSHKRLFIHSITTIAESLKDLQKVTENEAIKSKKLTLHILRHSIATHLLENKMPIESISRFLGHENLDTTQIYTHLNN